MRFLIDEQLPQALASRLVAAGHEAEHILQLGPGGASDREIWRTCIAYGAVLITKDEDFLALARRTGQVIWIRFGNTTTAALWRALEAVLPETIAALDAGERIVEIR